MPRTKMDHRLFSVHKSKRQLFILFAAVGLFVYVMSVGVPQSLKEDHTAQTIHTVNRQMSSMSSSSSSHPRHKKVQLLLVTNSRSGSSFTSALISSSPKVFYTFEPLQVINSLLYSNGTEKEFLDRAYGLLQSYLDCDFMKIYANDLKLDFLNRTKTGKKFLKCENSKISGFDHIQCLINFVHECRSKDISFLKVIRVSLTQLGPIMERMPKLKILYLVRDPRAVLSSQSRHFTDNGFDEKNGIRKERAAQFCSELTKDMNEFSKLSSIYPGRLKMAKYENGARNPVTYAKDIYSFLGLEFTNSTSSFISYLQRPSKLEHENVFGVRRRDPTKIIDQWRISAGAFQSAKTVDKYCGDVYSKLGYRSVTSQKQLISLDTPLVKDVE